MTDYIEGTNIPVSAIAGNIKGGADYWAQRLKGADTNINDVLFSMAYSTPFSGSTQTGSNFQGQGQGNPNVGALQSGAWKYNTGPLWAEEAVKNPSGMSDKYNTVKGVVQGADYGTEGNRGFVPATGGGGGGGGGTGDGTGDGTETPFDAGDNPIVVDDPTVATPDVAALSDEMKLSNKIQELINTNNPLFKAATTKAMQAMAKRGLVNSSIAQGDVMNSIMAVALPIAQEEVRALTENLYYNTDWTNKQKMMANEAAYNKMLTQLQGKINYTLQQFIEGSRYGLQQLIGKQQVGLEKLSQQGRMALQTLSGEQRMALQELLGEQGMDLQQLIGSQQLTQQQRQIAAQVWGKYGDWIMQMATAEGADQDDWQRILDLLQGAGGWPDLFPS